MLMLAERRERRVCHFLRKNDITILSYLSSAHAAKRRPLQLKKSSPYFLSSPPPPSLTSRTTVPAAVQDTSGTCPAAELCSFAGAPEGEPAAAPHPRRGPSPRGAPARGPPRLGTAGERARAPYPIGWKDRAARQPIRRQLLKFYPATMPHEAGGQGRNTRPTAQASGVCVKVTRFSTEPVNDATKC